MFVNKDGTVYSACMDCTDCCADCELSQRVHDDRLSPEDRALDIDNGLSHIMYASDGIMYANGRCVIVRRHGQLHVERLADSGWELCSIFDADELLDAIVDADYFAR